MKTLMASIETRLNELNTNPNNHAKEQEQLYKLRSSIQHLLKYVTYVGVDAYTDWDWTIRLEEQLSKLSVDSQLAYLNDVTNRAVEMENIKNNTSGDCKGIDWFNTPAEVLRDLAIQARHAAFY